MFAVYPTTIDLGGAMQTRWPIPKTERQREREMLSVSLSSWQRVATGLTTAYDCDKKQQWQL